MFVNKNIHRNNFSSLSNLRNIDHILPQDLVLYTSICPESFKYSIYLSWKARVLAILQYLNLYYE